MQMRWTWRQEGLKNCCGVLIGCDQKQEWMLNWWWNHYRQHNDEEVAFVDFGLSPSGIKWCQERGELITLDFPWQNISNRQDIPLEKVALWEKIYNPKRLWISRPFWFMKPLAMLNSPFHKTAWVDLDCEIRGSLLPLFAACETGDGIALVAEPPESIQKQILLGLIQPEQKVFNTGVVAYKHGSRAIQKWSEGALMLSSQFPGNQNLFVYLIDAENLKIEELPFIYNWRIGLGDNPDAIIVHWVSRGKLHIWQSIPENQGISPPFEI